METIEEMLNMDKATLCAPVNTVKVRQRMGGGGGRMDFFLQKLATFANNIILTILPLSMHSLQPVIYS